MGRSMTRAVALSLIAASAVMCAADRAAAESEIAGYRWNQDTERFEPVTLGPDGTPSPISDGPSSVSSQVPALLLERPPLLPYTPPSDPSQASGPDRSTARSMVEYDLPALSLPGYDATCAVSMPSRMQPGEVVAATITLTNTGTQPWLRQYGSYVPPFSGIGLFLNPFLAQAVDWGDSWSFEQGVGGATAEQQRAFHANGILPHDVQPGETVTMSYMLRAPTTGTYPFEAYVRYKLNGVEGQIGQPCERKMVTVGNPSAAPTSCPPDYEVIDLSKCTGPGYFGISQCNAVSSKISGREVKRFCAVVTDKNPRRELEFFTGTHLSHDAESQQMIDVDLKVIPPPNSGMQVHVGSHGYEPSVKYHSSLSRTDMTTATGIYLLELTIAEHMQPFTGYTTKAVGWVSDYQYATWSDGSTTLDPSARRYYGGTIRMQDRVEFTQDVALRHKRGMHEPITNSIIGGVVKTMPAGTTGHIPITHAFGYPTYDQGRWWWPVVIDGDPEVYYVEDHVLRTVGYEWNPHRMLGYF